MFLSLILKVKVVLYSDKAERYRKENTLLAPVAYGWLGGQF